MALARAIKQEAQALGFDAVGIVRVDTAPALPPTLASRLTQWLQRGFHATMAWMERTPEKRADPRLVLPGCRSIIAVGINYFTGHRADERPGHGRIARYAWGQDYHDVVGAKLKALEARITALAPHATTRSYADTGPIMEKAWAEQAGLGWIGKHSNLVSAEHGSWLLLGEILTTLELDPDEPASDLCGSCTLCIQACPTGAIAEPYVVDATRCISYLTIELRGDMAAVPEELRRRMGNHIFGCDDCLDVCPFNLRAAPTQEPAFQPSPVTLAPDLDALAQLDDSAFRRTFHQSPIKRAKLAGLQRNLSIAKTNQ
ncbi:MAG: tRNA epoxyqueuosine(34) reductase QueG [Nitrospira sp.]|jgi:epoxyqueuosine reductase|nr:tRNA epoxyqueuosine(34) reductase QueG [Nitrospira sp.]